MRKKEQNLTQAGTILLLSAILVKIIGALFKIPLSSDYALGDLGFGYFSAVYDLYVPIYTLAISGFPVAIAKLTADLSNSDNLSNRARVHFSSLKLVCLIGIIGSFLFCSLTLPIVLNQSSGKNAVYSIVAVAPSVFICSIASVYRGYFEGRKNMTPPAVSNVIEALGKLVLGLTAAIITIKLTNDPSLAAAFALFGITLGTLVSLIYLKVKFNKVNELKKAVSSDKKYDKAMTGSLLAIIIPVAIASLSMGIVGLIDSVTLRPLLAALFERNGEVADVLLKGTSYSKVNFSDLPTLIYGIKSKAHTIFHLAPHLTTAFGIGAVPLVTEYFVKKDTENIKKNVDNCLKFSSLLAMPIAFGCIFLSVPIMMLLYGDTSAALGGKILQIYSVATLFVGLTIPTTALLQGISKQKTALVNIGLGIFLKLLLNFTLVLIPEFNVFGAVIGTAVCFFVTFLLNMISLVKSLGFVPNIISSLVKPLISAVLCGLVGLTVSRILPTDFGTAAAILCGGIVYAASILILKVITLEDAKELFKFR